MSNKKIVYAYFCLDIIHKGHIRAMKKHREIAGNDGKYIIGILTDKAIKEKKPPPIISILASFFEFSRIKFEMKYDWLSSTPPEDTPIDFMPYLPLSWTDEKRPGDIISKYGT